MNVAGSNLKELAVDVAVIGAGTAGMLAFSSATKEGKRAVLIEGGEPGTTCARVGCMPSKLLIAAAERAHIAAHSGTFGIHAPHVRIDGREVMSRLRQERDRFVNFVLEDMNQYPEGSVLQGHARFVAPHQLNVGDQYLVNANAFVLATGSSPNVPDVLQKLGSLLVTNEKLFQWECLPESIIFVGTGVIALELGQALARLGVTVTFVGRNDRVGPCTDPEVAAVARDAFCSDLQFHLNSDVVEAKEVNGQAQLRLRSDGHETLVTADVVFAATGRRPNIADLDLDHAALEYDAKGLPVYDPLTMQCGHSNVFLAGDVTGFSALQHEAADEGRIAGRNAARFPQVEPNRRRSPLSIVFCDPQIAMVGLRFADLLPGGFVGGAASFENQGRSRIMGINKGLLKLYADAQSGVLLGAEMVGPHAEHLGHLLAWSHQQGLTVQEMLNMPFYHPAIEEAIRTALGNCRRELLKIMQLGADPLVGLA